MEESSTESFKSLYAAVGERSRHVVEAYFWIVENPSAEARSVQPLFRDSGALCRFSNAYEPLIIRIVESVIEEVTEYDVA